MDQRRDLQSVSYGIAVAVTLAVAFSAPAEAVAPDDPTADLLPGVECESPTCQEAALAFADSEYDRAGSLFVDHYDDSAGDERDGAWLVHAAYAHQRAANWDRAADLYAEAAEYVDPLRDYLLTQAVRASLEGSGGETIFEKAHRHQALEAGYRDGYYLQARLQARQDGIPDSSTVEKALSEDSETICPWLEDQLEEGEFGEAPPATLLDLIHAHCVESNLAAELDELSHEPSGPARLERAENLAGEVRFEDALAELDEIDGDELSNVEACRARFRRARSHFRLRQRHRAETIYRTIIDECTDDANEDQRVRSLYAVGNRNYQRGRLDEAERFFQKLYDEYPYRSHADDALFFLARIERARPDHDRQREVQLLVEALENYPDEDMIHEMAWEVYEPVFRGGQYRQFIDEVTALPLPEFDREYFSQGRLEYFVGLAHARLDEFDNAERYWQLAWVKYPFSFYGYLAHLRLLEHDKAPDPLEQPNDAHPTYWFGEDFTDTGADILARAGHLEGACDFESARLRRNDDSTRRSDRWRLAALCHQAGNHPKSHNVARRQISGRPWSVPIEGRLARWHVAWPDPYGDELRIAVEQYGPDSSELAVHPGFASAIMREESSFYEDIVSWAGAIGLMQLMPGTAEMHEQVIDGRVTDDRLKRAEFNIPIGIDHLRLLSQRFDGHPVLMTAAYNAGSGRIQNWLRDQPNDEIALWVEDIPILQTRDYTKRVIGSYAAYQFLQGDQTLDDRIADPARQ